MNSATVYMAQKFILVDAVAQLQLTVLDETYFTAAMRPSISLGQRTCLDRIFRHFSNRLVVCVIGMRGSKTTEHYLDSILNTGLLANLLVLAFACQTCDV